MIFRRPKDLPKKWKSNLPKSMQVPEALGDTSRLYFLQHFHRPPDSVDELYEFYAKRTEKHDGKRETAET